MGNTEYMGEYEEAARMEFPAGGMEIPVAQVTEGEADKLLPEGTAEEGGGMAISFGKPYDFEGETFRGIDLSGLEAVNSRQLTAIEKAYGKTGVIASVPETTATYAKIVAAAVTGLPAEFFESLPGREVFKIKAVVTRFFYGEG